MLKHPMPMVLLARSAQADIPPPPGGLERWHGELIRNAGFECDEQPGFGSPTPARQASSRARASRLEVRLVERRQSRRYLVGTAPRDYCALRPNQPPPSVQVAEKLD